MIMAQEKTARIEQKLISVLQSKAGQPEEAEKLIQDAKKDVPGADEWDVRKVLWRLTADGRADFTPGFKKVLLRS
jgi:hypothetical protein